MLIKFGLFMEFEQYGQYKVWAEGILRGRFMIANQVYVRINTDGRIMNESTVKTGETSHPRPTAGHLANSVCMYAYA